MQYRLSLTAPGVEDHIRNNFIIDITRFPDGTAAVNVRAGKSEYPFSYAPERLLKMLKRAVEILEMPNETDIIDEKF